MDKYNFLDNADDRLVDYYISDTIDEKGRTSIDAILIVRFDDFNEEEILLTKKQLKQLIADIEFAEENGVDYIED